jgi:hypothetical protein
LPNAFIRIKFRCIGWKLFQMNLFSATAKFHLHASGGVKSALP